MKRIVSTLIAMAISTTVLSDELTQNKLIERLEQQSTISADFEQKTFTESNTSTEIIKGVLKVERPLKFLWQVTSPYEQTIISDSETLWIYDPDLEQATYQSVTSSVSQSPAMILSQPRVALDGNYDIVEASQGELTAYRLFPIDDEALYQELTLIFNQSNISEIRIIDSLGQRTVVDLTNIEVNGDIDPSLFEFNPPPGTDLFEQL